MAVTSAFATDQWENYAEPYPIYSAISYKSGVMMATAGGIRYYAPDIDRVYASKDGLETSAFYALAKSSAGVFAVSEFGIVAKFDEKLDQWKVLNRSFLKNNVRVIPHQVVAQENILVIAFQDRLSFFDVQKGEAILTIKRIGQNSLSITPVRELAIHENDLFVSLGTNLYSRKIQWDNLASDVGLVNPDSWTLVSKGKDHLGLLWKNGNLTYHSVYGTWLFDSAGKESRATLDSALVRIDGKDLKDSVLYESGKGKIRWLVQNEGKTYLVGSMSFLVYDRTLKDALVYEPFQLGGVYELAPLQGGGVIGATADGRIAGSNGNDWAKPIYVHPGFGNGQEAFNYRMKVLSPTAGGYGIYHIWGLGFYLYSGNGGLITKIISPSDKNSCLDEILENYTTAVGTVAAPDSNGFLIATSANDGYGLAYINRNGNLSCAKSVGSENHAGPLKVRVDDETGEWVVYVSTRKAFDVYALGGLDELRFQPPQKNGGRLVNVKRVTSYVVPGDKTPVDLAMDYKNGVLWMVSTISLGYLDLKQDTIRSPQSTKGMLGAEYTSVDVDVQGNVWVGTTMQGVYRLSRVKSSIDTLSTINYTSRNGLLSNGVLDIAIDPFFGHAWFAHENGITKYQRNDLRDVSAYDEDPPPWAERIYPIPFRPKIHDHVTLENFPEKSSVSFYNRGGTLVRAFHGDETLGGRVDWDGRTKDGTLVAPGVYYYVVNSKTKPRKGKFLIIH